MAYRKPGEREKALRRYFSGMRVTSDAGWLTVLGSFLLVSALVSTNEGLRALVPGIGNLGLLLPVPGLLLLTLGLRQLIRSRSVRAPSDREVDQWLEEGINRLQHESRQKLGLGDTGQGDMDGEPLRIMGPILWHTDGINDLDLVWRKGKNRVVRFGVYRVSIIWLTGNHLSAYSCDYNFLRDTASNEETHEFHYVDIVGVSTTAQKFTVSVASGEALTVVVDTPNLSKVTGGENIGDTGVLKAVDAIRTRLRDKKRFLYPEPTFLDEAIDFFRQAGFVVTAAERGLGEFSVSTDKWATHTSYGSILVQVFRGDLSGDHLRRLEHRLKGLPVARALAYAVYEGELSDDAFLQMGAYKIGNGLTIIPLKAELLREALVAVQPNCYARLRVVEQEYLGQGVNRYEESNAITDPTWFFGRRAEIDEILDRLKSGQHAGIFGMRKIGKTSLLLHLRQSVSRLSIPVAYLGLQSKTIDPPMLFRDVVQQFRSLLESMGVSALPECGLLGSQSGASADRMFMEDIRALWQAARTELKVPFMLLMIDEADRIVPRPGSAVAVYQKYDQFFAPIRDLSQVERCLLTVVTAERPTIREEFKQSPVPNTMFELYDERYLASFSVAELENMIVRIGKWMGLEYPTESLRVIAEESACHPYVARSLCACIARNVKVGQVLTEHVAEAREDVLDRLHEYFLGWWGNLHDQERQILYAVLATQALPADMSESRQDALRYLQKQQVITQTPTGWAITIGLLREWLKRRVGGSR